MARLLTGFWRGDEGATAVEYGLMVALIAAVIIGTVQAIGGSLNDVFTYVNTQLSTAAPG